MSAPRRLTRAFEFEGQTVAYDMLGEGDPIVLVHGTPFSSFVWRTNCDHLMQEDAPEAIIAAALQFFH